MPTAREDRTVTEDSSKLAYGIAMLLGLVLWTLTAALGGRVEPWDTASYWSIAYPLAPLLMYSRSDHGDGQWC